MYSVKEIYYTIQGEGFHTGRPAVFLRFSGCNLWTGLEKDRHKAICQFCDTDFWGTDGENGGKYNAEDLAKRCKSLWPDSSSSPFIVCTGGEPLLQLDASLIGALHDEDFFIAIETNGTIRPPDNIDWICVSPKVGSELILFSGHELKLVYPQKGIAPQTYEQYDFEHFYLQPLDDKERNRNTEECVSYIRNNPKWKLSLQTHKFIGLP